MLLLTCQQPLHGFIQMKYRNYQLRMIHAQDQFMADPKMKRATILAATGSGKTVVFTDLIEKLLGTAPDATPRVLIVHPRLALSSDQQRRLRSSLRCYNVEFTAFSSGEVYNTLDTQINVSTTSRECLEEIMESAGKRAHITFSSYKSLHKIADMDFDLIICDEAHYLVQNELRENLTLFQSKVLFYTGTPIKVAADDAGMDNTDLFGPIIEEVPFSELIPGNYVVSPQVWFLHGWTKRQGNAMDYPRIIAHAYLDQITKVNAQFNHKMLVALPNTQFFDDTMDSLREIRKLVGDPNLDVYYVTGERVCKNGAIQSGTDSRVAMLRDFAENPRHCIILHCDTLAEGIDIDGIGGILLLRDLSTSKLLQTLGRACRPALEDVLPNGEIRKERIKTHSLVTLVLVNGELLGCAKLEKLVEQFEEAGYGHLWDMIDRENACQSRREGERVTDSKPTQWDEIMDIQITKKGKMLYEDIFGSEHRYPQLKRNPDYGT